MFLIFLAAIFIRPFISIQAFPYLNLIYSTGFLIFLGIYVICKKTLPLKLRALNGPAILFILALFISLIFSQNKINSLAELYKYITGPLLFLAAASLPENKQSLAIETIVLAGLAVSFLAIYQYFLGFSRVSDYLANNNRLLFPFASDYLSRRRVFLPFVTPGVLGGYLAMVIPLFLINKNRIWLVVPVFLALFLTGSLGAFLSLFCALIIYFCLGGKLTKRKTAVLFGLFISIMIIFVYRSAARIEHIQPFFSTVMRLNYWKDALGIIQAHPLAGVGLGNFNLKASRYAHNSYLQIWAEMGVLGLFAFSWIVYTVLKPHIRNLKRLPYKRQAACLFVASLVFLMHNFLDFTFFLPEVVFVWWLILGLIVSQDKSK
ncbi:MAG: O-antigen ligase family protein [Candidatus Omnitrophica bacterium]|nr:O-antigen ligase family protein [Candidatus Omnitrophota bacterium]